MRKTKVAIVAAIGTLVAGSATSFGDDTTPLQKTLTELASQAKDFDQAGITLPFEQMEGKKAPETCFAALKDAGVKPNDKVYFVAAWMLEANQKDGDKYFVLGKDLETFCKHHERGYYLEFAESAIVMAKSRYAGFKDKPLEGMHEGQAKYVGAAGKHCAEWVDKALAKGLEPTTKVSEGWHGTPSVPLGQLGDAKATYCQPALDFEAKMVAAVQKLAADKQQAITDYYKKGGMKGKRLELFVYYGMPDGAGWYGPGCSSSIDNVAALKKAKKLFHWLESSSGYTVRTYKFKGDNYTVSERTYDTQEAAYRGCK